MPTVDPDPFRKRLISEKKSPDVTDYLSAQTANEDLSGSNPVTFLILARKPVY
jgi:hypothetical protein